MLVKAGCSVSTLKCGGESPLRSLLKATQRASVRRRLVARKGNLLKMLRDCIELLLSAGSHVQKKDVELMNSDTLRTALEARGIRDYAQSMTCQAPALQQLCKIVVRSFYTQTSDGARA